MYVIFKRIYDDCITINLMFVEIRVLNTKNYKVNTLTLSTMDVCTG